MSKHLRILAGDNLESLRRLAADGVLVDSVVTDPPYGLSFMGKKWDYQVPSVEFWRLVYAVLKPGGHVLSFGGTRTYHRMACALEDAGFEIRDQLAWIYGSGFPKSLDVSKAIDKKRTEDIEPVRAICRFLRAAMEAKRLKPRDLAKHFGVSSAAVDHWVKRDSCAQPALPTPDQWRTLKRVLALSGEMDAEVARLNARKGKHGDAWNSAEVVGHVSRTGLPGFHGMRFGDLNYVLREPTPAAREWAGYGTALKPACEPIALARKPLGGKTVASNVLAFRTGALNIDGCRIESGENLLRPSTTIRGSYCRQGVGRMPAGILGSTAGRWPANVLLDADAAAAMGGASRFFYCAKASAKERAGSTHPTVKPVALMRYLCRLITPPGGTILDPFAGSGTTGEAALREGFSVVLMEREAAYIADIRRRLGAGEAAA